MLPGAPTPQAPSAQLLSIGEVAERTGLSPATLRMWEARHDFPQPLRLASGHRRYELGTVDRVKAVLRRQAAGVRLEAAIAAIGGRPESAPSLYAALRDRHPELTPWVLRKSTLLALSHAIEDDYAARGQPALLFGAFQHQRHARAANARWEDLAAHARATFSMAVGPIEDRGNTRITHVPLAADSPMSREWSLVCDGTAAPVVLSAWELPGQGGTPDAARRFETVWTLDPAAVRGASQICASIALSAGNGEPVAVVHDLPACPDSDPLSLATASRLFARIIAYVENQASPQRVSG